MRRGGTLRHLLTREEGAIAPLTAVLMVLLLAMTGLVTATALAVLLPNELRGLAVGSFIAIGGLIAFGAAPTLVAAVSSILGGEQYLAQSLSLVGFVVSALGCAGFFIAMKTSPKPASNL